MSHSRARAQATPKIFVPQNPPKEQPLFRDSKEYFYAVAGTVEQPKSSKKVHKQVFQPSQIQAHVQVHVSV
jgi:hypothetical protein